MSKTESTKIVKRYRQALKKANFPISAIYLFGSSVQGKTDKWSDIDIAVVSKKLSRNWDKNSWALWNARLGVDTRIEPHGFTPREFADNANPLAYEIRHTGIRIV